MTENFLYLVKDINLEIYPRVAHVGQRQKISHLGSLELKLDIKRNLKAAREQHMAYWTAVILTSTKFLRENMEARK